MKCARCRRISAMVKMAVLTMLALAAFHAGARADGATATATACDQDPRCYGRELAVTLTAHSEFRGREIELSHVVTFEPGRVRVYSKAREKIQAIVEQWKRSNWSLITVHGYAAGSAELGQRRAEKIRGYLVRYGVPPELVQTVGQTGNATVDLSIVVTPPR